MNARLRPVVLACVVAAAGAGIGVAQASPTNGAAGAPSTGPAPLPLPPVGSVATTPTTPPSTACGPGPVGGGIITFQNRIHDHWPQVLTSPDALGLAGLWFDNDTPALRLDVLSADQIAGLCQQAVAHGLGGDVRVDVVPTTIAQVEQMQESIRVALNDKIGMDQFRIEFGGDSIKTWSLDIAVAPGTDHAVVDQIAQQYPVAYSIRDSTDVGPLHGSTDLLQSSAGPGFSMLLRAKRATARRGITLYGHGLKAGSTVTAAFKRGSHKIVEAGGTAAKDGTAALKIHVPSAMLAKHGATRFTVSVVGTTSDGKPLRSKLPLRVG